jgi:hypothetical protein
MTDPVDWRARALAAEAEVGRLRAGATGRALTAEEARDLDVVGVDEAAAAIGITVDEFCERARRLGIPVHVAPLPKP